MTLQNQITRERLDTGMTREEMNRIEDFTPCIYPLTESVPVAISEGELTIDLRPVAESIRELGSLP